MNVTAEASARWAGASVRAREAEVLQGGGAQDLSTPEKRGWAHPPLPFPMKGRRRKEVCPPIVTEQGAEKSEE